MTDNDFADPWGLPPTAESGEDDVAMEAPAQSPAAPEPPTEPSEPEVPEETEAPEEQEESARPPESESEDDAVEESVVEAPEESAAIELVAEDDQSAAPPTQQPPPASSGPYSQVLAAASGLFGRSTTPTPAAEPEPVDMDTEIETTEDVETELTDDGHAADALSSPDDIVAEMAGSLDDTLDVETAEQVVEIDDTALDDVDDVLASLDTAFPSVEEDATDTVDVAIEESDETVSLEQIAAMASQLEVETPEPFEVTFSSEDDQPTGEAIGEDLSGDSSDAADVFGDVSEDVSESAFGDVEDEDDISIDMDSSPAVFEQLSEPLDEPVAGGFDVGAVFRSGEEQQAAIAESTIDEDVPVDDAAVSAEDGAELDVDVDTADEWDLPVFDDVTQDSEDDADVGPEVATAAAAGSLMGITTEPFASTDDDETAEPDDAPQADAVAWEEEDESQTDLEPAGEPPAEDEQPSPGDMIPTTSQDDASAAEEPRPSKVVDSGEVEWGARWHESAQGWVEDSSGQATWRPIVTTAASLSEWEVDTYLGIVVGDSPVSTGAPMDTAMALSRQHAIRLMVDEALSRGAHAVIGVQLGVADVGSIPLATATGTAVTLKPGDA